jgi:haloalkane dehalogenase
MTIPADSSIDANPRRRAKILDTEMSYADTGGAGRPIVFLHGNPTSSYLWRNVIPHLAGLGRCLAPDLVGMGDSGPSPEGHYRFADHARYLDAWFDSVELTEPVVLVLHDWGGALGFDWARRHRERMAGLAYMEALVRHRTWAEMGEAASVFKALRSEAGEKLVLDENMFIEKFLPSGIIRTLDHAEMDRYRAPFRDRASRHPMLAFSREIPIEGEPADVRAIVDQSGVWLAQSTTPKLFVRGDPGRVMQASTIEFCRTFQNQKEVVVPGMHFLQEDSPVELGDALAAFVRALPV